MHTITHCVTHWVYFYTLCVKLHTMCGIKTTFMITQGCVAFSMEKIPLTWKILHQHRWRRWWLLSSMSGAKWGPVKPSRTQWSLMELRLGTVEPSGAKFQNFFQISEYQPNFRISTKFSEFQQNFRILPKFQKFCPNLRNFTRFQNFEPNFY